jgi:cis-3-alkyl-4-acyloxetan-2-one decarboxylase
VTEGAGTIEVAGGAGYRRLYPFRSHWLEVEPGKRMHYLDEGPREGPVLLMVHGNPTWSFYFRELIRAFAPTHRVVAIDHLGCGLSDKPEEAEYRLAARIEHAGRLVANLGLADITLVAHDWGGAIGMGLAVERPALFRRFVVMNSAAFPSRKIPPTIDLCRVPGLGAVLIRGLNAFSRVALIRAVHHRERLTAEVRDGYLAPYASWSDRLAQLRFVQDIPMSPRHPSWPRLCAIGEGLARFVEHPMLLLWGARDFCFDLEFLAEWRHRFPNAEVEVYEDASHYVLEDAHERIAPRISRFLQEEA